MVASVTKVVEDTLANRTNYYFEASIVETILSNRDFLRHYNRIFGEFQDHLYPALLKEIAIQNDNQASHRAIICDMCQMAPALTVYPQEVYGDSQEFEPVEEFLCSGCLEVRKEADKATNLASWEGEADVGVAFFRITIDMSEVVHLLKIMFMETFGLKRAINEDLGFSIIDEFILDYERLLDTFKEAVFRHENYGEPGSQELILRNLFCVKTRREADVRPIVNEYVDLLTSNAFFSQMVNFANQRKLPLPIKLSVTLSSVKYPFMEHWQSLNYPTDDINILAIPHTILNVSVAKYLCLRSAGIEDRRVSSALYKLQEIEDQTRNRFLVTTAMLEMKNDLKGLARFLITTNQLSIDETLAYYKFMKNGSDLKRAKNMMIRKYVEYKLTF